MLEYRASVALTAADGHEDVGVGGSRLCRLVAMLLVHRNSVVSAHGLSEAADVGESASAGRDLPGSAARNSRMDRPKVK
jgi:hypothetical protein